MTTPRKYTKELLEPIVAECTSVAAVLRALGLRQNGGTHSHISRTIRRLDIDTAHFNPHAAPRRQPRRRAPEQILVRQPATYRGEKPTLLARALREIGRAYACAACGIPGIWMGRPLTLEVDHIDGDFLNNSPENLRFLCPNCHRQTPNFAGRSRGRHHRAPPAAPAAPH